MHFERYPKVLYQKKETKPSFWFGLTLFIIGILLTLASLNIYNPSIIPSNFRLLSLNKKTNILLLGCDEIFDEVENGKHLWRGRSDSIILLSCNPSKNTLNILNIPRDTKIKIPSHGIEKINYLNTIGGPTFTKKYLEVLLKTHIDHYVIVNVQGLNKIIDELGGVVIDVPQRMQYTDHAGMLNINLFPGKQLLKGKQSVDFLRFRHDNLGDIGRIQRQQEFIRAIFKKLLDPITFTKLPEIVSIYKKTMLTSLKPLEIIKIANFIRNIPRSRQNIVILPGEFSRYEQISYWIPNKKEINNLIKKLFYDEEKELPKFIRKNPRDITISIFNSSNNKRDSVIKLKNLLTEYGYTVLQIQNSGNSVSITKIYAQKANPEIALQVKQDIGNFGELLVGNLGPPEADVTILAGMDVSNLVLMLKSK